MTEKLRESIHPGENGSTTPFDPFEYEDPSDAPSSGNFESEDFLFHLYRGSELLQDNCVAEAKEELERAFKLQPQDLEGQSLLGVVYFRLGLYPRAIAIYREMIERCPKEATPRVNLALCFLKTGQPHQAREALLQVIAAAPDHKRAWGYLGLCFQQLGDIAKAHAAFERAEQPHMARRMEALLEGPSSVRTPPASPVLEAVQAAAGDMVHRLDALNSDEEAPFSSAPPADPGAGPLQWNTTEPGRPTVESHAPRTVSPAASALLVAPPASTASVSLTSFDAWLENALISVKSQDQVAQTDRWLALQVRGFALRTDALIASVPTGEAFRGEPLHRRVAGKRVLEQFGAPLGGLTELMGDGLLVLRKAQYRHVSAVQLATLPLYLREGSVLGFDTDLSYENGRFSVGGGDAPMAQFLGKGRVLVESDGPPQSIKVEPQKPVTVRSTELLGWVGRLLVTPLDSIESPDGSSLFSSLSGEGLALLDLHRS
ncbi:MAG: tetratricopeptide repeat protein [Polyangiaceae bacterium]|nr:tetratricopeptide repeat protein [Polyangiaceae bacterium]